jgi:hypothetical protein
VLGSQGAIGHTLISGILIEDNEDVVEVGSWDAIDHGALLRASTDWIEHYDAHGLEKYEPTRNVEILEVPGYEHADDVSRSFEYFLRPYRVVGGSIINRCAPLYHRLVVGGHTTN